MSTFKVEKSVSLKGTVTKQLGKRIYGRRLLCAQTAVGKQCNTGQQDGNAGNRLSVLKRNGSNRSKRATKPPAYRAEEAHSMGFP